MTRVLVTDARRGSALAFIRSLGRRGDHVVAADATWPSAGMRSRYAAGRVRYPSPVADPAGAGEALVRAAHDHRIDVIVPVTDEVILALRDRQGDLPSGCQVAMASPDAARVAADKDATIDLARRLGVPVPETVAATTATEVHAAARRLGFPVVLKPMTSRRRDEVRGVRRYTVAYALDEAGIDRALVAMDDVGVLVQRFWEGVGEGVELLLDHGTPIAAFQHRRLREVPVSGGASSFRESVALDPVLFDHSVRLLSALDFHGLAMVEFRVGPDGPVLMEINGRVWGSLPLAVAAGMDFPARLIDLYTRGSSERDGGPVATAYSLGVRARNLDLELVWIGSVLRGARRASITRRPPRRAALRAMTDLFRPGIRDDILSWSDPGPGVAELVRIAGKLTSKVRGGPDAE